MKNWKHVIYLVCAIQIGAGISMMGIMSFLPLFLSELGITDPGELLSGQESSSASHRS